MMGYYGIPAVWDSISWYSAVIVLKTVNINWADVYHGSDICHPVIVSTHQATGNTFVQTIGLGILGE